MEKLSNQTDAEYDWFMSQRGRQGPIIDANPPKKRAKKVSEWTFTETCQALFALAVVGTLLPIIIIIGGLTLLAVWDYLTGT